ncbi:MAG: GNAT family protein [Micropepsaceae bacterium]
MSQTLGPTLRFDTPDFTMRSLALGDESDAWGAWFAEPRIAQMLNGEMRARTLAELRDYIKLHDRRDRHLFGIFTKSDDRLIGIRTADIDRRRRACGMHIVVGSDGDWGRGAMEQTVVPFYNWAFETHDLLRCEVSVLARNRKMARYLLNHGWKADGGGMLRSAADGSLIEATSFHLHRDTWRKDQESSFFAGIPAPTGLEPATAG